MSSAFLLGAYPASNARHLPPEEVAKLFVPHAKFEELLDLGHSLLVGPRGSGKTTLLKMLTLPAIRNWRHPRADAIRLKLPFVGVYVPADIVWQRQIASASAGNLDDRIHFIRHALVTTNLLKSFAAALADRIRHNLKEEISRTSIAELWSSAQSLFGLAHGSPSADGVVQGLGDRFSHLSNTVTAISRGMSDAPLPDYCHIEPIPAMGAVLDRCGTWFRDSMHSWALCFDELEILDPRFCDSILRSLRSTDQRFILKLSVAPFQKSVEAIDSIRATSGHDFAVIPLWYPSPSSGGAKKFTLTLARKVIGQLLGDTTNPSELLGESTFVSDSDISDIYAPGSEFLRRLKELSTVDPTLARYLETKQFSLDSDCPPSIKVRNELLRKIKPSVLQRMEFAKEQEPGERRTRKLSQLYTGFDVLHRMSEGNPRWLIGILRALVREWRETQSSGHAASPASARIPTEVQARVFRDAAGRYMDFLRNWPSPQVALSGKWPTSLAGLIDRIGSAFFKRQVIEPFSGDPKGSFDVDSSVPESLLPLIEAGVVQGAFVDLAAKSDSIPSTPRGRRYRLSFVLTPEFGLLQRILKSEPLSRLVAKQPLENPRQGMLPDIAP